MKRIFAAAVCLIFMLLSLSGCGDTDKNNDKPNVVCTIFPQYDFVREIAGDRVNLTMLVPFGVESHDFQLESLTVTDLKTVGAADLFISVGGESDSKWVDQLKETVKGKDTEWLTMVSAVDTLEEIMSASMEHEEADEGDGHEGEAEYDEHVWTSPKRAVQIVTAVTAALCRIDGENAEYYSANRDIYIEKLNELDRSLTEITRTKSRKMLIFADRFAFRYLCADYGLDFDAAFPGCSAAADPSVAQISSLTERALSSGAKIIFHMENSKTVYAERIAEKVGAKVMLLHSCHTVSKAEHDSGATYLSLMKQNIKNIAEALV